MHPFSSCKVIQSQPLYQQGEEIFGSFTMSGSRPGVDAAGAAAAMSQWLKQDDVYPQPALKQAV